jgi:hypothetical protein
VPASRYALIAASRIGAGLGLGVPKCLVPVAGRPAIDYLLAALVDVPNVRMIVGFREQDVMAHVRMLRPDVVFVRDPAFLRSTTLETLRLGVRGIDESFLLLDGDAIYGRDSLTRFREECADGKPMLGISTSVGPNPIYAAVRSTNAGLIVTALSNREESEYAWTHTAMMTAAMVTDEAVPLFRCLGGQLPVRAGLVDRIVIDSVDELREAAHNLAELTRPRQGTLIQFPKRRPSRKKRAEAC